MLLTILLELLTTYSCY